jgi:hypothetical protein
MNLTIGNAFEKSQKIRNIPYSYDPAKVFTRHDKKTLHHKTQRSKSKNHQEILSQVLNSKENSSQRVK